jgi:multidrug transporter EmrE-like cation transporter
VSRIPLRPMLSAWAPTQAAAIIFLLIACVLCQVVSNSGFKYSATSGSMRGFMAWQVVGNIAGFISVPTITGLLRFLPLSVVFPVSTGLAIISIQIVAAQFLFHESISSTQWLGTLLVVAGIALIGGRR